MSDQDIRIPKGILKNKYGSSSREAISSSSYGASDVSLGWNQPGMLSGPHGGMVPVAPVPAPNHGMNMPNPILDPVLRGIGSGFPSPMHQKLNEFMSNKRELLFRPLDADETPMSEVKGTQRNTEDHYGIVPSFDHFLRVDNSEIRRYFFQNAVVGDIVIGKVVSRSSSGLYMHLLCTEGGKHIILEDLNVRAYCPAHLTIPVDSRDANRFYEVEDIARLEILEIVMESDRLIAGMKGTSLSAEMQHSFQLGVISRRDLPKYYVLSKYTDSNDPRVRRTYQELLHESPGFRNPNSTSHLAANMGIFNISNSLMKGIRLGCPSHENASQLRRLQNARWAHGHVAEGRKYFKLGKFTEAFQSLNSALNIDRENVEALVTRGALYASKENYEKAIDDFESALKFNPNNLNAKKYLAETLVALGRQQEGSGKLEDAIASYSKSLVVWPDHKEAKEALWSLHARTEKLDPAKLTGPAAAKAVELKAKLKTILQSELGMKVEQKTLKEKKSKKDKKKRDSSASEDSSSSSSSDDSSSDSSSSGSGYKKRSKKRRKKKSKKSKKSRRESGSDKRQKEPSLSPFSKRLADTGSGGGIPTSGFSGFTDSTYAELQLGISKHDRSKNDSNGDDGKRSSKKSKEKKRSKKSKDKKRKKKRGASSDSSSTDSESERSKKKSKKPIPDAPLAILPDLGDLEAKLSAYYSKIEQGKIETKLPATHRSRSRSRSRSRGRERERRSRSKSPLIMKRSSMDYDIVPPRTIENVPPPRIEQPSYRTDIMPSWSDRIPGKIDLQTDEYGNMLEAKAIICTVQNDFSMSDVEPPKPSKFEMKFKPMSMSGELTNKDENGASAASAVGDAGSKWRPLGAAMAFPQSEAIRNAFGKASSPVSDTDSRRARDKDKRYRKASRSHSRSPRNRKRRSRSFSRSRSGSRSYSRSRSRSRSPSYRRRGYQGGYRGGRGRAPVRFFRGYNYPRGGGGGGRRPYTSRSFGHDNRDRDRDYGGGGGGGRSKFRNRFSHTPSRSRSRSRDRRTRSRSISPHNRNRRERSVDDNDKGVKSPPHQRNDHPSTSKMEADSLSQPQDDIKMVESNEIHLGKLKGSGSTTDLEILLDIRKAEKKEEMRKSNPDFFRAT